MEIYMNLMVKGRKMKLLFKFLFLSDFMKNLKTGQGYNLAK